MTGAPAIAEQQASSDRRTRIGACAWLGCLQYFALEAIATRGFVGHYSYRRNYMSDLGAVDCHPVICSHWHALMNTSFVLQGICIATGALVLPARRLPGIAGVLARVALLLSALGVIVVGFTPEDVDVRTHIHGAMLNFGFGGLGLVLLGLATLRSRQPWLPLAAPALAGGIVALASGLLFLFPNAYLNATYGVGFLERITAYPIPLLLAWFGFSWLRRPVSASGRRGL